MTEQAEVKQAEVEQSTALAVDDDGTRWLVLDDDDPDGRFRLRDQEPFWIRIALRRAMRRGQTGQTSKSDMSYLLDQLEMLSSAILADDDEVDRLDAYMLRNEDPDMFGRVQEGITEAVFGVPSRPLELRSTSSTDSSSTPPDTSDDSSQPDTEPQVEQPGPMVGASPSSTDSASQPPTSSSSTSTSSTSTELTEPTPT